MPCKLVWITPEAEKNIIYIARVSNPANQDNPKITGLLKYLIKHKHVSPFEMANMCIEITTTRAISAQIIRHRSFSFQEFSQRYAEVPSIEDCECRLQDSKNRQGSLDVDDDALKVWWDESKQSINDHCKEVYKQALEKGIAKECARFLLPMSSTSKLYMNGTIRSWIHYLEARTAWDTQKEHRELAEEIKNIFSEHMPTIAKALGFVE